MRLPVGGTEIEPGDGLADIVLDNAPRAPVGDGDDAGGGQDQIVTASVFSNGSNRETG